MPPNCVSACTTTALFYLHFFSCASADIMSQFAFACTPIAVNDRVVGSGFIVHNEAAYFLLTCKSVVEAVSTDMQKTNASATYQLSKCDPDGSINRLTYTLSSDQLEQWKVYQNLACWPLALDFPVSAVQLGAAKTDLSKAFYCTPVQILGYPRGRCTQPGAFPLARVGSTAFRPDLHVGDDEPVGRISATVYQGDCGALVAADFSKTVDRTSLGGASVEPLGVHFAGQRSKGCVVPDDGPDVVEIDDQEMAVGLYIKWQVVQEFIQHYADADDYVRHEH